MIRLGWKKVSIRLTDYRLKFVPGLFLWMIFVLLFLVQGAHADFFANSTRRDLTKDESKGVLRIWGYDGTLQSLRPGCGGFLVKNSKNQIHMMTARHCLDNMALESCQDSKFKATIIGLEGGRTRFELWCKRVVAGSSLDDMVLFEMTASASRLIGQKEISIEVTPAVISSITVQYSLADFIPRVGVPLSMLGFPADPERKSAPTLTEGCQVQPSNSRDISNQLNNYWKGSRGELQPVLGKHNCSVYGGNSGGPIFIKDTSIFVALPFSYYPNQLQVKSSKASAMMEMTKGFIDRNRNSLITNGVELTPLSTK